MSVSSQNDMTVIRTFALLTWFMLGPIHQVCAQQAIARKDTIRIVTTSYLELVAKKIAQPGTTPEEAAEYANSLMAKNGFDYEFDACPIVRANRHPRSIDQYGTEKIYYYSFVGVNGRKLRFELTGDPAEALCGECAFEIPLLRVTSKELLVVSGGKQQLVKRPTGFELKKISIMDSSMRRTLRTWEVPLDTELAGVSQDGTKIYLELLNNYQPEDLVKKVVLEASQSGLRFMARNQLPTQSSEYVKHHPKDPRDPYLAFRRFRVGHKSYIIRYDAPCT